jgi:hypothetical protein
VGELVGEHVAHRHLGCRRSGEEPGVARAVSFEQLHSSGAIAVKSSRRPGWHRATLELISASVTSLLLC